MSMTTAYIPYADDVETVPADEGQHIAETVETIQALIQQKFRRYGKKLRDVHVKSHGCAEAVFQVLPKLPRELAQGLFAEPRSYAASIRFSNASPIAQADGLPDGRGLAIQVRGVSGEFLPENESIGSQDFVMVNHPVFLASDVADYLRLQKVRLELGQGLAAVPQLFSGLSLNPLRWPWREISSVFDVATQFPRHPAAYTYYSMTPFRYGEFVVKYRVRPPVGSNQGYLPEALWQPNAMRLALERTLARRSLVLDFQVQLRASTITMAIEDATREWPESESPFRTVALIELPRQDLASRNPDRGDSLSWNVWHCLAAHRPLGGINRSRKKAYRASVIARQLDIAACERPVSGNNRSGSTIAATAISEKCRFRKDGP
ncbi:MAG: catalase family protein [Planctomycetaceae bacterium]|nr:catalase family protein [Planctomycetaceae bacterium]